MTSPPGKLSLFQLCCLILAMVCPSAWASVDGEITGVALEDGGKQVVISCKGKVGKHLSQIIGDPNRLVIDFEGMRVGKDANKTIAGKDTLNEIRLGHFQGRARVVVDFRKSPVPPFKINRDKEQVAVVFEKPAPSDNRDAGDQVDPGAKDKTPKKSSDSSALSPDYVPAAAQPPVADERASGPKAPEDPATAKKKDGAPPVGTADKKGGLKEPAPGHTGSSTGVKESATRDTRLAQVTGTARPESAPLRGDPASGGSILQSGESSTRPALPGSSGGGPRMVREVRPPVTPPTPDPRLVVQEITELKFIQVGHNSRLIVRGGDHLDYRLNKASPTKVRLDLINAEIPKVHQKPLRTDLFSTSVEMIVPGSQTIFIQLKDAVPYQVNKQKGVLMIDFPPPRFAMTEDQKAAMGPKEEGDRVGREEYEKRREALLARREATRIMREEETRRQIENIQKRIDVLLKDQEDILKERREIERRYRVTGDPEVFSKPVTMDFQGIGLRNVFRLLAEQAGLNLILGTEVSNATTVTMRLFQVPLGEVIDHILKTHNLDRDLVGNVMWIGSTANIAASKNRRSQEHQNLLRQADNRLAANKKEIADREKEREKALEKVAKEEAAAEELPAEAPNIETVGATETITIEGEPVTLLLIQVKLNYARAAEIASILRCVFNRVCVGIAPTPREAEAERMQAAQDRLTQEGFQPGSPGAEARLERARREAEMARRTEAAEAVAERTGVREVVAGIRGPGMDRRLQRIIAHTMVWPNTQYNMLFIKDLPERI